MTKITAVCYVDIGTSWGPAIHFLEVWNRVHDSGRYKVDAYACCDTDKPYIESPCVKRLFKTGDTSAGRFGVKLALDLYLFTKLLFSKRHIVYIRWAQYCMLTALACRIRGHQRVFELNGLIKEDCKSASSSLFRRLHYQMSEHICLNDPGACIIAVSKAIETASRERYSAKGLVTIPNGCKPSLNNVLKNKKNSEFTIAYVGTFTPWDGHMFLPQVAQLYESLGVPIRIQMAGLHLERSAIYRAVTDRANFDYRGNVPYKNLDEFYATADAGIALYEFERHKTVELSSLKLYEYFACRLPIITTAVPGTEFVDQYNIGIRLNEKELNDPVLFGKTLKEFYGKFPKYKAAYLHCPPARTWQDVANETMQYLEHDAWKK